MYNLSFQVTDSRVLLLNFFYHETVELEQTATGPPVPNATL